MTQNERILTRLRLGPVTPVDFQLPDICDGGKPILRVAARIHDLEAAGYAIRSERLRNGTSSYTLISEPGGPVATTAGGTGGESVSSLDTTPADSLFDTSALTQRPSYRDAEAA